MIHLVHKLNHLELISWKRAENNSMRQFKPSGLTIGKKV